MLTSKVLNGLFLYEKLYNSPPSYEQLRAFRCLCYVTNTSPNKDKFSPRSSRCVFIRYPYGIKGYKMLDLEIKKVSVSRDVKFIETEFLFKNITNSSPTTIFTTSNFLTDPLTLVDTQSITTTLPSSPSDTTIANTTDQTHITVPNEE